MDLYGIPREQADKPLRESDGNRASYLRDYTIQIFRKAENYHLCIDSGTIGIENTVKIIEAAYRTL